MEYDARLVRSISISLIVFCLAGCGALPVGIAPDDGSADGCRPSSYEPYYDERGRVNPERDPALYDEERIKRCEQFYNKAERQRKEALSEDLEEHMNPSQQGGANASTEPSVVIRQDVAELD